MPTVGWIREGDWEAFLEATETVVDPGPRPAPSYQCPFCTTITYSSPDLQRHLSANHFVARPILLLDGKEPSNGAIRRHAVASTACLNSTRIILRKNGKVVPTSIQTLAEEVGAARNADFSIELFNSAQTKAEPVTSKYDLAFRVANAIHLKEVELAFQESIMQGALTRRAVDRFLQDHRCAGVGQDYANALASYVIGILLKERPPLEGITTPLARYRETYGAALRTLSEFKRPFARLVVGIIRFSLNEFRKGGENSGYWELDLASRLMTDSGTDDLLSIEPTKGARRKICPVDHATGQVLDLAVRMVRQQRWSPILSEACRQTALSSLLDEADRQKVLAVWAISSWRLGARNEAIEPLRQIAAVYPFAAWAERYLEMMGGD